ncbi:MAG: hypothetical protein IT464_05030 [Planctomycetes bacterium]|nr:hypothetical protein [Planctomycetota bacterium]
MRWEADSFLGWAQSAWWVRWLVCAVLVAICSIALAFGRLWLWLWAITGVLVLINVFLSWNDILDRIMPRRK